MGRDHPELNSMKDRPHHNFLEQYALGKYVFYSIIISFGICMRDARSSVANMSGFRLATV